MNYSYNFSVPDNIQQNCSDVVDQCISGCRRQIDLRNSILPVTLLGFVILGLLIHNEKVPEKLQSIIYGGYTFCGVFMVGWTLFLIFF